VYFEIIGEITEIETIATGGRIRDIMRVQKQYGTGHWRKLKGIAKVRLANEKVCEAEIHWYGAQGIGRKKIKIEKILGLKK
jgi:hypothetical protein